MPPTPDPKKVRPEKPAAKPGKPAAAAAVPADDDNANNLNPPDEKFWQRYSPNGEPLLSGLSSFVVHALVIGIVMVGIGWLMPKADTEELEPVLMGNGIEGGGGGDLNGQGNGPQLSKDDTADLDKPKETTPDVPVDDAKVVADTNPRLQQDPDTVPLTEMIKKKKPAVGVFIKDAMTGITGKGGGGTGWGGGTGNGVGKGIGNKDGDGTGPNNKRGRRALRWEVNFNTTSGADYVRQLQLLGSIIGVPDTKGKWMFIRNLNERPARPAYEDLRSVNRVFMVDDRPEAAAQIAEELRLDVVPTMFAAFYSVEVEKQIVETELAYGKKYGRKTEDDITQTVMKLSFRAGKPVFTVLSQKGR